MVLGPSTYAISPVDPASEAHPAIGRIAWAAEGRLCCASSVIGTRWLQVPSWLTDCDRPSLCFDCPCYRLCLGAKTFAAMAITLACCRDSPWRSCVRRDRYRLVPYPAVTAMLALCVWPHRIPGSTSTGARSARHRRSRRTWKGHGLITTVAVRYSVRSS